MLGILVCVPFVTGLLAAIFGILGVRRTRDPRVGGRGMAIAGIVLGLSSLAIWSIGTAGFVAAYRVIRPVQQEANALLADLALGNVDQARARTTPAVTREELEEAPSKLEPLGEFKNALWTSAQGGSQDGAMTLEMRGTATFGTTKMLASVTLVQEAKAWKVSRFRVD